MCLQSMLSFLFGFQLNGVLIIAVVEFAPDRLMLRVKKPEGLWSRCCRHGALAVGGSGGCYDTQESARASHGASQIGSRQAHL